jgi:ribosomal protein L3 glutamine methyltransferase
MTTLMARVEQAATALDAGACAYGHGTTNSFDEAAWLVLWALKLPLDSLDEEAETELSAAEEAAVQALLAQRIESRRPAAYLTGEAWLQGVPFTVDERVIVPRSLIAEPLVEGLLEGWLPNEPARVLDLCTGNGSLAVLAALQWTKAKVVATDLSADALAVAAHNVKRHELGARISLRAGDGLAAVERRERFELILCNPPYVNATSMAALPAEYRAEPPLALAGGADGMDFIRQLLPAAALHLMPGCALVLEIGNERAHFDAAFPKLDAVWLPTSAGDEQVLLLTREALLTLTPASTAVTAMASSATSTPAATSAQPTALTAAPTAPSAAKAAPATSSAAPPLKAPAAPVAPKAPPAAAKTPKRPAKK